MAPQPAGQECGNCRFFTTDSTPHSFCRRYPPAVVHKTLRPVAHNSAWPEVSPADWCGEWAAADAAEAS